VRELRKDPQPTPTWQAFSWFWLLASGLWFLAGLRLLAFFSGLLWLDRLLFYFDEVFAGFHLVAGSAFLARHVWGDTAWTRGLIWFAGIFVLLFLGLLFWLGIRETICTPWASEHELPQPAFLAFVVPYLLCLFLVVYATIRDVVARNRRGEWVDFSLTLATWSLLVYSWRGGRCARRLGGMAIVDDSADLYDCGFYRVLGGAGRPFPYPADSSIAR
jgi:hypothetical protein